MLYRELIRQGDQRISRGADHQIQLHRDDRQPLQRSQGRTRLAASCLCRRQGWRRLVTIAHNVGWAMSQRQNIDTIITDLDLAFGTAALNFNQDVSMASWMRSAQPDRVDATLIERLMTKLGDKLSLLNGPGSSRPRHFVEAHAVETILNVVRYSAPMVVVDVPNMWAPWIKYTLLNADEIIITATPELPSLRNAKNLVRHAEGGAPQ
jgi:pilus assembly protein CpaE